MFLNYLIFFICQVRDGIIAIIIIDVCVSSEKKNNTAVSVYGQRTEDNLEVILTHVELTQIKEKT